ncbi:hypothetical protein [Paenibacillus massiliensis]|uniref:hypothetical protein n=1 Tax=Paenibacillus massiliensis TaxID=225917 RepID=UPI00048E3FB6|nr:hypothetical protein [Paenibacillus massiliensis]
MSNVPPNDQAGNDQSSFLFNVDVLVQGKSNAVAFQSLLEIFNTNNQVADFRVHSGIELGNLIEAALYLKKKSLSEKKSTSPTLVRGQKKPQKSDATIKNNTDDEPAQSAQSHQSFMHEMIHSYIQKNSLVRLVVNRYGGQRSIPCRILNLDKEQSLVSVYHVDEKQVYSFKLNEIDEIIGT